jgi:iron complex outermembrane receptor protein
MTFKNSLFLIVLLNTFIIFAQDNTEQINQLEEITVVGSQIKNKKISDVLPISIITEEDIDIFGVQSGDELLDQVAEMGGNFFNEGNSLLPGINSARGDIGAYNLRGIGTGNTLVLLNGRRLISSAVYKTELIGGDYIPANSVNSNLIPIYGQKRLEILRDGASALYGSDAIAGVINHVIEDNFDGFSYTLKSHLYDHVAANDKSFNAKYGKNFNTGLSNITFIVNLYDRDNISASEDSRWANSDGRGYLNSAVGEDSPFYNHRYWDQTTGNSQFPQIDLISHWEGSIPGDVFDGVWTDFSGDIEIFALDSGLCQNNGDGAFNTNNFDQNLNSFTQSGDSNPLLDTGYGTCIAPDGNGLSRHNRNVYRDIRSSLNRKNIFVFLNHDFDNGLSLFTELGYYDSKSKIQREADASFGSSDVFIGPDYYYTQNIFYTIQDGDNAIGEDLCSESSSSILSTCAVGDKFYLFANDTSIDGDGTLLLENYRFTESPRLTIVNKRTTRFLQGFRGVYNDWDWETAFLISTAKSNDITNRISMTLLTNSLNSSNPDTAYNIFSMGVNSNVENISVPVSRISRSELKQFDIKFTNNEFFKLPAGFASFLFGAEIRSELMHDDRSDHLDGTIIFMDYEGDTHPYVSDVAGTSPTNDVFGKRRTSSTFFELGAPLSEKIYSQLALRYENPNDFNESVVSKFAIGYQYSDMLLLRSSLSSSFRAPSIIQINEDIVARSSTQNDALFIYFQEEYDKSYQIFDDRYRMKRVAQGSKSLDAEESSNYSYGFVFEPIDNLILTYDIWSIEKNKTIGLIGRENQILYDLILQLENNGKNCSSFTGNVAVIRLEADQDQINATPEGFCPVGEVSYINDEYENFAKRIIRGSDLSIYFTRKFDFGDLTINYSGSFIEKFIQEKNHIILNRIDDALANSESLNTLFSIEGFGDLLKNDKFPDNKHSLRASLKTKDFLYQLSGTRLGSFYQPWVRGQGGEIFKVEPFIKWDLGFSYFTNFANGNLRLKLSVKNIFDERAPLAVGTYHYESDYHSDLGRNYYLEARLSY